mmetsp:Transcript_13159/g.22292  ORF Transcript_13159/g.22292 Transcript_13159/m.22292 type:complete len:90 (-) Transcript_13159:135-404(-)
MESLFGVDFDTYWNQVSSLIAFEREFMGVLFDVENFDIDLIYKSAIHVIVGNSSIPLFVLKSRDDQIIGNGAIDEAKLLEHDQIVLGTT